MSAERHWSTTDNGQNRQANQSPLCHTGQSCSSWQVGMRGLKKDMLVASCMKDFNVLDLYWPQSNRR